jgi:hypothetical protein
MTTNDDELIPVEAKDQTALRHLSAWVIYRLCRTGALPHVRIGRRRYLTRAGIAEFLARGGEGREGGRP